MAQTGRRIGNILSAILTALLVTGPICAQAQGRPVFSTHTLMHDGITREYQLFVPERISRWKQVPLVIVLHGGGGSGRGWARSRGGDNWIGQAREDGFIVVFPEGYERRWNDGREEIHRTAFGKPKYQADDVGFIDGLIDVLSEKYPVDRERIFATGISNGGFMSFRLALDLSEKIRAIAPVTAQISRALEDKGPRRPVSLMLVNGTEDPLVPYDGGHVRIAPQGRSRGEILSTEETVRRFAEWNGCGGGINRKDLLDLSPADGTRIERISYTGCDNGTAVILLKVHGGGHTWPGGMQYLPVHRIGRVSRDLNATQAIADFFLGL